MSDETIKKTCSICKNTFEYTDRDDISNDFYLKKTHSGTYHQNACKECTKKKHREKYASGEYNWVKRHRRDNGIRVVRGIY